MQFPIVNATIKLSPTKREKNSKTTTGNRYVVKEVKSSNQIPPSKPTAVSKVVEVSVPREALKSRYQQTCPLPSVPLIEVKINKHGFQVRFLL